MDINSLSRKMYDTIPEGGTLFTIDKIALSVDTCNIILENYAPWKKDNYITILLFGETTHILIHAEFEPWENNIGKRCFDAILVLLASRVFKPSFTLTFFNLCSSILPFLYCDKSWCTFILSCFFKLVEWEWATDFLDYDLFSFINTDISNRKSLRQYKDKFCYYSKDNKRKERTIEQDGNNIKELKSKQKSFLNIYDKGEKIGSKRKITRMELRIQGKHKKTLSASLLEGTIENAFTKSLPYLKKSLKKVIEPDTLVMNNYWKDNIPYHYEQIFS